MKGIIVAILLFFAFTRLFSQVINTSEQHDSITLYEKLYIHTDREIYTPGDDIWFKSYLVSGINHKLIPGNKNIYVQLISENGNIIDNRLMLSLDGVANNDFYLSDSLPEGFYTIRAYTKYLQNFGEESFFHKRIEVADTDQYYELENKPETGKKIIDISFLPEGGNLVLNAANHIAFKAVDETGKGIDVSGNVVDDSGDIVAGFKTRYMGMGRFIMMPQEGKTYYAKIDNYPDFHYRFNDAKEDGIALSYHPEGNNLLFTLSRNIKSNSRQNLVLVASHKGSELFREELEINGFQQQVEVYKGFFPLGISKITVIDNQQNILAERLVFVRNANDKTLEIKIGKNEYEPREKVITEITSLLDEDDTIQNTLSVAVVNNDYFNASGISQTIESYLLLDSELKGPLESPASYFTDEKYITADEKLDLIMLINGWRRYYWDDLQNYTDEKLPGWDDIGLEIKGRVKRLFSDKPVVGGVVELGPFSGSFLIERDTTDEEGRFSIDKLYLKDSAVVMINAETKSGRNAVEVFYEPSVVFDTLILTEKINKSAFDIKIPERFYRSSYNKQLAEREFELESESILLEDIDVFGERNESDGHVRIYGEPQRSIKITEDDWTYSNILEYLEDNGVAGVIVTGDEVRIRGASGNPLFLVDGLKTDWEQIMYFTMMDIDKIEILKDAYYTTIFGSEGGNGIISVLTRTGEGAFHNEFVRNIRGRITPEVRGFHQAREFYSPKYPLLKPDEINKQKPDFRPTLYWDPNLIIESRQATIDFFTSDMLGSYSIIMEGISKNGKICFGTVTLDITASEN